MKKFSCPKLSIIELLLEKNAKICTSKKIVKIALFKEKIVKIYIFGKKLHFWGEEVSKLALFGLEFPHLIFLLPPTRNFQNIHLCVYVYGVFMVREACKKKLDIL